jgi:hypothetical protein
MAGKYYCPSDLTLLYAEADRGPGEWSGIQVDPEPMRCPTCHRTWALGELLHNPPGLGPGVDVRADA